MRQRFVKPSDEDIIQLGDELRGFQDKVVKTENTFWYIKTSTEDCKKRERLAHLLGSQWLNIAEVRYLDDSELEIMQNAGVNISESQTSTNTYLIRLAQSYSVEELRVKDVDSAVAGELVFSYWIRRRDAHVNNRAYVEGTPIFFDHHITLGAEENKVTNEGFFATEFQQWAVKTVDSPITTTESRNCEGGTYFHYINDVDEYRSHVEVIADEIRADDRKYSELAQSVGFNVDEASKIERILEESRKNLDTQKLLEVTLRDS